MTLAVALVLGPCARAQDPETPAVEETGAAKAPVTASARQPKIVSAKVVRRPSAEETAGLYPPEATKHAKQGKAVVTCEIALSTRLENCAVKSEDPPGFGFGAALLKATAFYRIEPPTVNGRPVPNVKIDLPMRFQFDLETAAAQLPASKPAEAGPVRETPAERLKRLGPLTRSDSVLWAPLALAAYALAGLAWALFAPLRTPRRIPGQLA